MKAIILRGNGPSFCTGDDLNVTPYEAFGGSKDFRPPQTFRMLGVRGMGTKVYEDLIFLSQNVNCSGTWLGNRRWNAICYVL